MKIDRYIALAALALGFAACSQEDIVPQGELKDTPITIQSAGVAELITRSGSGSTPLVGTTDAPVSMGVYITGGSADTYNYSNVKYTHNGTSWAGETMLYEGASSKQQMYAYYPYAEGVTGTMTVNAADQKDYLVATSTPLTSSTAELTLTHALTKLTLAETVGAELMDDAITKVEVQGMYASGTWTMANNAWSELGTANASLEMKNKELLIIPMASCQSFPIVITTEKGRVFQTTVSLGTIGNKLEAGKRYEITFAIKNPVNISATIAPWTDKNGSGTATPDFE